jgi:hypothetical protein
MTNYKITDAEAYVREANYSSENIKNMYSSINLNNLIEHSYNFDYTIYEMYEDKKYKNFVSMCITTTDFKNRWPSSLRLGRHGVLAADKGQIGFFMEITPDMLQKLKKCKGNDFKEYILQRSLWPEDETLISHKRIEYEVLMKIIMAMGNELSFTRQQDILGYKADLLFKLEYKNLTNVPSIILEIDEDGKEDGMHKKYDNNKEIFRDSVCKHFANRVIRIPVPRKSTDRQLDVIANKYIERLENIVQDLVSQHMKDINPEYFIQYLNRHNIERQFIDLFYNGCTDDEKLIDTDSPFKYDHRKAAQFLGYNAGKNGQYRRFRELIKNNLDNEDYRVIKVSRAGAGTGNFTNKSGNTIGLHKLPEVFMLSRVGFFIVCMCATGVKAKQCRKAFARVYDVSYRFAMSAKRRLSSNMLDTDSKRDLAEERLNAKAEQKKNRGTLTKLKQKLSKTNKELLAKNETIGKLQSALDIKTSSYLDSKSKHDKLELKCEEQEKQLDKTNNKYKKLYKKEKISRDKLEIELSNTKLELQKLKNEIKVLRKERETYKERLKVCEEKAKKKPLVQKYLDKIKKYKNKIKDKIKQIKLLKSQKKIVKKGSDDPKYKIKEHKPALPTTTYTVKSLMKLTVVILKGMCKTFGIKGHSKKRKAELVDHMLESNKLSEWCCSGSINK